LYKAFHQEKIYLLRYLICTSRLLLSFQVLQKPIYQNVNGTQLTADWSAAAGISKQF